MRHSHARLLLAPGLVVRQILRDFIGAAAGATVGYLWYREHRARSLAERMAAATLETLLNAVDANDPETGAHVRRVAAYALIIARALDLPETDCREVERAALFHDIGKIHEALFDLVHEPEQLSEDEYRLITTHTERGAEVLRPLESFYPSLADGVLAHHERWDGSGYPRGLTADAIPLIGRIIAVADSFDAITHSRRYKQGLDAGEAAERLLAARGTQFDPELVDLVLLPPVFDELLNSHRELHRRPRARSERRTAGVKSEQVPEVRFRWRPGSGPSVRGHRTAPASSGTDGR
jgi:putative nucleotidyltransferase with HDIG domain